jgi:hypothetical protein
MKVFCASNPTEAHIVCGLLHQHSSRAEVRGEGIFGLKGELPLTEDTDPYVWLLQPSKVEVVKQLISDYQHQQENLVDWTCTGCGEVNEGQFGLCWNCSHQ